MVRRSRNSFALLKSRLRHRAIIKRSDAFLRVDAEELEGVCRRIAGNTDFLSWSQRDDDGRDQYVRVVGFAMPEKAAEMQAWVDQSGIALRPVPKLGPTEEELVALREESLKWGFATGATRRVVQAYRRKMFEDGEGSSAECAASATVIRHRPPADEPLTIAMFLVEWAKENHADWFYRRRKPINVAE